MRPMTARCSRPSSVTRRRGWFAAPRGKALRPPRIWARERVRRGGRTFYESPAAIGCALAVPRKLYDELRGFDPQMLIWGVEDLDLSLKCHLAGHAILHDAEARIGHRFRRRFDNYEVPVEHVLVNKLRMAYKNFTQSVWGDWVEGCRAAHPARLRGHPEGLWARAWDLFQSRRASADAEHTYLHAHRERDEFWYAERFALNWPRIGGPSLIPVGAPFAKEALVESGCPSPKGTIFISGYWPPTNVEQPNGMLNQFKSATRGTLGEYIVDDYKIDGKSTGYKLVTIGTEFPGKGDFVPGQDTDWGGGAGFWQVDYPLTSYTFWRLMKKYAPIAVMTTSRRAKEKEWLLEIGSTNLARANWDTTSLPWNEDRPPYIGGSDIDPAKLWGPNAGHGPKTGNPPDATQDAGSTREVPGGADNTLLKRVKQALQGEFDPANLVPKIADVVQGTAPDNYVSAFAGYHAVWYAAWKDSCKAGWHTHVDYDISLANVTGAIKTQLGVLIQWLNEQ